MATVALAVVLAATGCTEANKVVKAAAQSPITPIVLKIVHDRLVEIVATNAVDDPAVAGVALMGVFGVDALSSQVAAEQKKDAAAGDVTLLLVAQTINGKAETSVFKVTTDHKLVVAMNGKFIESLEPKKITITAEPGTDSTIVVTDAQASQIPYLHATVAMGPSNFINNNIDGDHSHADLDTGQVKNLPDVGKNADLYVSVTGSVATVNGAKAARWTAKEAPSLAGCSSLPDTAWTTQLYGSYSSFGGPGDDVWCVRSKQGRYGTLAGGGTSFSYAWNFGYVLWKKPGDK
ncbi:hypothetical protein ACFW1A_38940 [Kitasatospora sp. NPDC058965]|uniref:hypothetical protein n=1 Tax=Kitasatospora sp. NPDC058965 TaxID=3346682 RepID=UPI003687782B